jgi:long-chain acyl-CoA synthetase
MPVTAAIRARAATTPDELALGDDSGSRTWAQVAADLERAAGAMLAVASDPAYRISVLGDNAIPTLEAHAAGLTVGVGTVATSRQLRANELADQYADAGVVCAITGTAALAEVAAAAKIAGVESLVVHGAGPDETAPDGAVSWADWLESAPPVPSDAESRPPRPLLVYTSGTTGRARGAEVRWTVTLPETARDYVDAITAESAFPPGPHLVVGPLQHNAPLTSVRHLLAGQPVIIVGKFDAETIWADRAASRHVVGDGADASAAAACVATRRPRAVRRLQPEVGEPDWIGLPGGREARDDQLVRPDIR